MSKPGDKPGEAKTPVVAGAVDDYQGAANSSKSITAQAAPEVSQGAWRERVFTPRAVMSAEQIGAALREGVLGLSDEPGLALVRLREVWLAPLRQALEQSGGDGLDAWLAQRLGEQRGTAAKNGLLGRLVDAFNALRNAPTLEALRAQALQLAAWVEEACQRTERVSFKVLERELEGKLEVDALLRVLLCDPAELERRQREVLSALETLREQLRAMPGAKPDGLYSNFTRLKAEARVLEAELRERSPH